MAKEQSMKAAASMEVTAEQIEKIESDYHAEYPRHQALLEEVAYILAERLKAKCRSGKFLSRMNQM